MGDLPPHLQFDRDTTGAPRWVRVFGIIALVLVVLAAILLLTGGGSHGPGRHTGGQAPSAIVTQAGGEGVHTQPPAAAHTA